MFEAVFQTFEDPEAGVALTARLALFREELVRRKLTGFVIPRADQQQNEYVAASEERLAWLTGFTGSAGMAVVLTHEAAVFVDGRYTLQAAKQVDTKAWQIEPLADPPPENWLAKHLAAGDRLGFDPWLHTSAAAERLAGACAKAGAELIAVDANPLDSVWTERPAPPLGPVAVHGPQLSGEAESEKLRRIRLEIARLGVDALVLSDSHAVAWTFNIRGADVSHTPLPLSYALVPKEGRPTVFIDHRKLSNSARDHLEQSADVEEPDALTPGLTALAAAGASIALDSATAADALSRLIVAAGGKPVRGNDPVSLLKAVKNSTEIEGTRTAHRRDAVALARFLAWIDREAPTGALTEIDTVEALETFRRRHRRAEGRLVPDHRRHRPERRHRALPRHPQDQPADRVRRSAADRFRRAIRGRHHRRHPHHRDRRADDGNARPLHPRAARPHRDRARDLSRRHHRRAARHAGAAVPLAGRPRFRSRHRPRRRQLSLGA